MSSASISVEINSCRADIVRTEALIKELQVKLEEQEQDLSNFNSRRTDYEDTVVMFERKKDRIEQMVANVNYAKKIGEKLQTLKNERYTQVSRLDNTYNIMQTEKNKTYEELLSAQGELARLNQHLSSLQAAYDNAVHSEAVAAAAAAEAASRRRPR
jgi:hypothetical protein